MVGSLVAQPDGVLHFRNSHYVVDINVGAAESERRERLIGMPTDTGRNG